MNAGTHVMVTGHRDIAHPDVVGARLREVLTKTAATTAISGGAEGADALYADAALASGVALTLMLPNRWYRSKYPRAVPDRVVDAAAEVAFVVDRPDVTDWSRRWTDERWWVDNFARNAAMVAASTHTIVVSSHHPHDLVDHTKGGTAACLRDHRRLHPDRKLIWVPDDPARTVRWVSLPAK